MRSPPLPSRKRIRLFPQAYVTAGAVCSITIAVRDRRRVFSDVRAANTAVAVLRRQAARTYAPVHGYCVMPDHVHLVMGSPEGCSIITFVGAFKGLVQRELWALGVDGRIWQPGFYDHFLRKAELVERVVEYVLDNPVRAGLVRSRKAYEFSGSLVYEL